MALLKIFLSVAFVYVIKVESKIYKNDFTPNFTNLEIDQNNA